MRLIYLCVRAAGRNVLKDNLAMLLLLRAPV